jgi:hypothetical protein
VEVEAADGAGTDMRQNNAYQISLLFIDAADDEDGKLDKSGEVRFPRR